MTLGENIERLRVEGGHGNAAEFARRIGVSPGTLGDWEKGRYKNLRLDNLLLLAKNIPCTMDELVIGIDPDYEAWRTAKGGRVRVVPLTPQAVSAWKEFTAAVCWKDVPQAAPLNRWLQKVTGMQLRVYDLRHSYGTALARQRARLDTIGSLMGHSSLELTKRYTLAAVTPDALSATARLSKPLPKKVPAKKSREKRRAS